MTAAPGPQQVDLCVDCRARAASLVHELDGAVADVDVQRFDAIADELEPLLPEWTAGIRAMFAAATGEGRR